jgi:hypothetical protein
MTVIDRFNVFLGGCSLVVNYALKVPKMEMMEKPV